MKNQKEINLTLPIYYTQEFKTKKDKTFLVGMNWYRNAHFIISNEVKKHYHDLVMLQTRNIKFDKIKIEYNVFLKNTQSDGPNVRSILEKFVLDGLVKAKVIVDDNVKIVKHDSSNYFVDKKNPRIEIRITEDI